MGETSADGLRILYLTSYLSMNHSGGFRGRSLVETFLDDGHTVLVRHIYLEDREKYVDNNPALADDLTDASEFDRFAPEAVVIEGGLYQANFEWKLPASVAIDYVERGGVLLVLDAGFNKFSNGSPLMNEVWFFGGRVDSLRGLPYLKDKHSNDGRSDSDILIHPDGMLVSEWLRKAFVGVESIVAVQPVPLAPTGEIACSTEVTARKLVLDRFVDDDGWAYPIATVRQHRLGYAGVVAADVSMDPLTDTAPGNIVWITQLITLLAKEARRLQRLRGPLSGQGPDVVAASNEVVGDLRELPELIQAPESETFELKETIQFSAQTGTKDEGPAKQMVEAVQELWNLEGGSVVIGVRDQTREVIGLERDLPYVHRKNEDGLLLKVTEKVKDGLGPLVSLGIRVSLARVDGKLVVRIDVPRGATPAYFKGKTFRVRQQNGGIELFGPALEEYLAHRFPQRGR